MGNANVTEAVAAEAAALATVAVVEIAGAAIVAVVEIAGKADGTVTFPLASPMTAEPTVREPMPVEVRTPAVAARVACPEIEPRVHVVEAVAGAAGSVDVVVAEAATAAGAAGW